MTGNVWEWCWDKYGRYNSTEVMDPKGAAKGAGRSARGGSWNDKSGNCRVSARLSYPVVYALNNVGFRTVMDSGEIVQPAEEEVTLPLNDIVEPVEEEVHISLSDAVQPAQNNTNSLLDKADREAALDELQYYLDAHDVPSLEDF